MNEPRRQNRDKLEAAGYELSGNVFRRGGERFLPLYEAKMMRQFTHRWATYEAKGKTREMTSEELRDPHNLPLPRYWVHERDVEARLDGWDRQWLLVFRNITNTTNERTAIFAILPICAVAHSLPVIFSQESAQYQACFLQNVSSYIFDYVVRQKMGGINLTYHIVKQLPVIPPHTYFDDIIRNNTTDYDKNRTEQNRTEQNRERQFCSTSSAPACWN